MAWSFAIVCVMCLGMAHHTTAYGVGAPAAQCVAMTPGHGTAQTGAAPYQISLSTNVVSPGQTIQVTIKGTSSTTFKGFLIEARRANPSLDQDTALGTWNTVANTKSACNGAAVTHSTNKSPWGTLDLVWTAPNPSPGNIEFRVSIVQSFAVFWVQLKSPIARDPTAVQTTAAGSNTQAPGTQQTAAPGVSNTQAPSAMATKGTGTSGSLSAYPVCSAWSKLLFLVWILTYSILH